MSQASGMAENGPVGTNAKGANKALPVLLLALAVALGVALLHGLDESPTATEASLATLRSAQEVAAAVPPTTATPTTLPTRSPSEVKVLVTNGTATAGVAAKINSRLAPIGYVLGTPGNTTTPSPATTVQYAAGYEAEAQSIATSLGLTSTDVIAMTIPAPVEDLQSANVVVVIGTELAASTAASNAATSTTSVTGSTTATTAAANAGLTGPLTSLSTTSTSAAPSTTTTTTSVRTN